MNQSRGGDRRAAARVKGQTSPVKSNLGLFALRPRPSSDWFRTPQAPSTDGDAGRQCVTRFLYSQNHLRRERENRTEQNNFWPVAFVLPRNHQRKTGPMNGCGSGRSTGELNRRVQRQNLGRLSETTSVSVLLC